MSALPQEAEKLLAVAPGEFVAARKLLVAKLREDDRPDNAATVAGLRKPPVVVYAVNRAARDRPKAARAAAEAAERVGKAQVGNEPEAFTAAVGELEEALDLLAEVAVANVAPRGKAPTDVMRRRVRDLLRSAVADEGSRGALARGALTEELEAVGFSPFAGMAAAPSRRTPKRSKPNRAEQQEAKRREREEALRKELASAEQRLDDATRAVRDAERERTSAERAVAAIRGKLEPSG